MLLAFGTSYTQDMNRHTRMSAEQNSKYRDWHEQCWVQYLGEKLNMPAKNMGVAGVGIQTYFARITDALIHYPQTKIALIEIPSPFRNHFHIRKNKNIQSQYNNTQIEYWQKLNREENSFNRDADSWKNTIADGIKQILLLNYSFATFSEKEIEDMVKDRFNFNKIADIEVTAKEIIGAAGILAKSDPRDHQREIISHCIHIDGYLKHKGIIPVWWAFNHGYSKDSWHGVLSDVPEHESLKLINEHTLLHWCVNKKGWEARNTEFYTDGHHLNSDLLKVCVDEYFLPELDKYIHSL